MEACRFAVWLLVVSLSVASPAAWSQDAGSSLTPIKLDQAIDAALHNNLGIKNSELDVEIARDKLKAARTHFLPVIRVSAFGLQLLNPLEFDFKKGVFGTFPETGPIPAEKTAVRTDQQPLLVVNTAIVQPVLQLGRIWHGVRQTEIAQAIAREKLRAQRQQVVSQIRHSYYRTLEMEDSLKVIEATKALYREIDRMTSVYLANRVVLAADSIEVKQQLANAEYEAVKLKNGLASEREELSRLMGSDKPGGTVAAPLGEVPALDIDLPAAQARAFAGRAELKQIGLQSKQIDLERRVKRLKYVPDLNVIIDYFSVFGAQVLPTNVVVAGFMLNWEPVDWGRRHWEIAEQKRLLLQSTNAQRDMEMQITLEVNGAFRKLEEQKQFMQVAQLSRQLATEKLRVAMDKYKDKANLLRDVLQAERDLSQANNQYTQAVLGLWNARADLEKAMGED